MNTSGWGGVWERQRLLAEKVDRRAVEEIIYSDGESEEEVLVVEDRVFGYHGRDVRQGEKAQGWKGRGAWPGPVVVAGFGVDGACDLIDTEASGEEMWEEWWEDDDLYSRLEDVVDLAIDDIGGMDEALMGFEGEMENDPDFAEA